MEKTSQTPVEMAAMQLGEAQTAIRHQVEELASRLRPVLTWPYGESPLEGAKEATEPEKLQSPAVRTYQAQTRYDRETSEILSHILKNLEV